MTDEADHDAVPAELPGAPPPAQRSIVPRDTIAGRALVAVIAIMTFLAALTLGAVVLIRATATEWQSEVAREVTIQVRPAPGRDIEADVKAAAAIAAHRAMRVVMVSSLCTWVVVSERGIRRAPRRPAQ